MRSPDWLCLGVAAVLAGCHTPATAPEPFPTTAANETQTIPELTVDENEPQLCPPTITRADITATLADWPKRIRLRKKKPSPVQMESRSECTRESIAAIDPARCDSCVTLATPGAPDTVVLDMDGPHGSGRYRTVRVKATDRNGKVRGACIETSTVGARHFSGDNPVAELSPLPWRKDIDGDGREEILIWTSIPLGGGEAPPMSCHGLLPVAYKVGTRSLTRMTRQAAGLYKTLADVYTRRHLTDSGVPGHRPHYAAIATALQEHVRVLSTPSPRLPAVSADGTRVATPNAASDPKSMASWVTMSPLDGKPGSERFTLAGTGGVTPQDDELHEQLVIGGFSALASRPVNPGASRASLGGLSVRFRGRRPLSAAISCRGTPLVTATGEPGEPTEIAYVGGPHPHLLVYVDISDNVGSYGGWWLIPLPRSCD